MDSMGIYSLDGKMDGGIRGVMICEGLDLCHIPYM
jgi:hypothetical protein